MGEHLGKVLQGRVEGNLRVNPLFFLFGIVHLIYLVVVTPFSQHRKEEVLDDSSRVVTDDVPSNVRRPSCVEVSTHTSKALFLA